MRLILALLLTAGPALAQEDDLADLVGSKVGETIQIDVSVMGSTVSASMAANPCNPCGGKAAMNPCNPCGGKAAKNPCNPCGG